MIRISWSALKAHEECRQKSKLMTSGARPSHVDIRNYVHGTIVDRCMRYWLDQDDPQPGGMVALLPEQFDIQTRHKKNGGEADGIVRWRSRDDKKLMFNFCRELLERLEPILMEKVIPYEYQPAVWFSQKTGSLIQVPYLDGTLTTIELAGEIDLLGRYPSGDYFAIDLKGTANPQYIRQTLGQGVFYDLAIRVVYGRHPVSFEFVQPMVETQPVVAANITDDDRRVMMARIVRMATFMFQRDWQMKTAEGKDPKGCLRCDVRSKCPRFSTTTDADGVRRASFSRAAGVG